MLTTGPVAFERSPRIVQTFLEDEPSQVAIGLFVATFVQSMLSMREIAVDEAAPVVPGSSVLVTYIFVIIDIVVLVATCTTSADPSGWRPPPTRQAPLDEQLSRLSTSLERLSLDDRDREVALSPDPQGYGVALRATTVEAGTTHLGERGPR